MPPQKKSTSGTSRTGTSRKSSKTKNSKQANSAPIRREVGALLFFFAAVFAFLGLFIKAPAISFLSTFLKGLVGWGYYILPFVFICCSVFLLFHRGKPVSTRVISCLLISLFFGGLMFLFFNKNEYSWKENAFSTMYKDGIEGASGGILNGVLGKILIDSISGIGAFIVFFFFFIVFIMLAFKLSPVLMFDAFRNRERKEYVAEIKSPVREKRAVKQVKKHTFFNFSNLFYDHDTQPEINQENPSKSEQPEISAPPQVAAPAVLPPDIPVKNQRSEYLSQATADSTPIEMPQIFTFQDKVFIDPQTGELVDEQGNSLSDRIKPPDQQQLADESINISEQPSKNELLSISRTDPIFIPRIEPSELPPIEKPPIVQDIFSNIEPNVIPNIIDQTEIVTTDCNVTENDFIPKNDIIEPKKVATGNTYSSIEEVADVVDVFPPKERAYLYPTIDLLSFPPKNQIIDYSDELRTSAMRLIEAFKNFGVGAKVVDYTRGPSITRYEIELDVGTKLARVTNLSDDIALALGVVGINISPVPNKAGIIGIEVPNKTVSTVYIRDVIDSNEFKSVTKPTSFVIGRDIAGSNIVGDIKKLTHLIVAGTTGSGKSVCVNTLLISLLYKAKPDELKLIMIDPKMVEFGIYNGLPHLLIPVVTDPQKAAGALEWACIEMDKRFRMLQERNKRDIDGYNDDLPENVPFMPRIIIVIDEMADLMMMGKKSDVETNIARIAQKARACGMHLILATQRPDANVVTGLIKANIPSQICMKVATSINSRVVIDEVGGEKLIGNGDLLYKPNGASQPMRVQGCWVSTSETENVIEFIKNNNQVSYAHDVIAHIEKSKTEQTESDFDDSESDDMLPQAVELVIETGRASTSFLQTKLKLGYNRATRIIEMMEERGIVGPFEGAKPRKVLITKEEWQEKMMRD